MENGMSDALNAAAEALKSKLGESGFDGSVKFDIAACISCQDFDRCDRVQHIRLMRVRAKI